MHKIPVFVSHSWSSAVQYEALVELLDSISDLEWHNVSVVRDDPLKTGRDWGRPEEVTGSGLDMGQNH